MPSVAIIQCIICKILDYVYYPNWPSTVLFICVAFLGQYIHILQSELSYNLELRSTAFSESEPLDNNL